MSGPPGIVVAGEALVDLVPRHDGMLVPLEGGAPFNVAIGLGRLGVPTGYLGVLSTDAFGRRLRDGLLAAGVDLALSGITDAPTTLAVVHLDDHERASYGFYLAGTSAMQLTGAALPALPPDAALLVAFGAIGLASPPAGEALVQLAQRESRNRTLVLDPNVRLSAIDDLVTYREQLEGLVRATTLIKVSDEDLTTLWPDEIPEDIARRWAVMGPALVVVTRGPEGALAVRRNDRIEVPGRPVEVVDTVGAGDAFTAALLAHLHVGGHLAVGGVGHLDAADIGAALRYAVEAAAITCTRRGADPPTRDELPET